MMCLHCGDPIARGDSPTCAMRGDGDSLPCEGTGRADRKRETFVHITVRVVPLDTSKPVGEVETSLLFTDGEDLNTKARSESVARSASLAYERASGGLIPNRPEEGGR